MSHECHLRLGRGCTVTFNITFENKSCSFSLATLDNAQYHKDTLVNGYSIKLVDVLPYPDVNIERKGLKDYSAQVMITKE